MKNRDVPRGVGCEHVCSQRPLRDPSGAPCKLRSGHPGSSPPTRVPQVWEGCFSPGTGEMAPEQLLVLHFTRLLIFLVY